MGGHLCAEESKKKLKQAEDDDEKALSYVGKAGAKVLMKKHAKFHHKLWNVTSGQIVGEVHQTPHAKVSWQDNKDPPENHDNWFPENMARIMSQTQIWCDVTSLGPPDGEFLTQFQKALGNIAKTASGKPKPIIVRMMFGNIVGMPVNCEDLLASFTKDNPHFPEDANINLWVGAWRKGVSWNHSKIIAVDGQYLHNGGHNLWDPHYLRKDPVHDLSMEARGRVAHDGHLYANEQWRFIEKEQTTFIGSIVASLPDNIPMVLPARVTVSQYPDEAKDFPPQYKKKEVPMRDRLEGEVPIISLGRYGDMVHYARASDDAFVAMIDSAKKICHFALQDLGPITLPGLPGPQAVPGCGWPAPYLEAMGRAIWERGVDIEIALSNPGSIPNGMSPTEALYGNGWSCAQVASEIIKTITDNYEYDDEELRKMVLENLRVCYIKEGMGNKWADATSDEDKGTMGMHAKHFIIDDIAYYIGSQNLYVCDLAEWGLLIDDAEQTKKCMAEYWNPLWKASFTGDDCDPDEVIDNIDVDRSGGSTWFLDHDTKEAMKAAKRAEHKVPADSAHHDEE